MLKTSILLTSLGLMAAAYPAMAADDPIKTRQEMMKSNGKAAGALGKMIKGETPYDPAVAELAMRTIFVTAIGFPSQFPEGTETGGETEAAPKIWEDKAGFAEAALKLQNAALAAVPAAGDGLDQLKANFGSVADTCKGCHDDYRIKKEN